MTIDKKIGFERLDYSTNSKSVERKQVVAREKTKFKMKIVGRQKKVKRDKRRKGGAKYVNCNKLWYKI